MQAFCDDLRGQRERRGISLASVSEGTKVPMRHLLALEEGRFAELPGGIFRKGILRGYLQAIGVDAAPWVQRFELCLAEMEVVAEPAAEVEPIAAAVEGRRVAEPVTTHDAGWSGVMVLLVLLLMFGWCVWRFALRGHVVLSSVVPSGVRSAGSIAGTDHASTRL